MSKKEIKNVGFMKNVMVPVDVKTNLANIDATELHLLYKERELAVDDCERYLRSNAKLEKGNNQLVEANEKIQKENAELKEENERLINKIINMKLMLNSVYGAHKGCDCHICYVKHSGQTAFAKAAESLVKFLETGKPTYDQLLEENEKLRKENSELKCKSCGKNAELYAIDDIIGATGPVGFPTYDELRKECEELRFENEAYKERNIALRDDVDTVRNANIRLNKEKVSLQVEIDELDKECDTLVEEKEKLQAEVDSLLSSLARFEKGNDELKNAQYFLIDENTTLKMEVLKLREMNGRVCEENKELKELCDEKDKHLENVIKCFDNTRNACFDYENALKEELDKVTKELESYKKQCSRLENEKINAWACARETIETRDKEIKSLETRLDNVIRSRKEINDEYTAYVKNNEDQSYYEMWHNLADEYCKLEDKYNKVYIQYEKYKKYCEDIVDKIVATKRDDISDDILSEPSGTGCCLDEE